jgi:O-antigen/teichoic acid export membrane protein
VNIITQKLFNTLRWSEKYTHINMVRLANEGFWLLFGKIGLFLITFFVTVAFGNWLPKEIYGIYNYVLALMGFMAIFSLQGINTSLIISIARKKEGSLALAIKTRLRWGIISAMGMFLIAGWYLFHDQQLLAVALFVGGIFLSPYSSFSLFSAYWSGKQRFDIKSKYELISSSLVALCLISTVYLTNNLLIILSAFFISQVVSQGFFLWLTLKKVENKKKETETIRFGKNLTLIGAIPLMAEQIDKIILWNFFGPIQLATYVFAIQPLKKITALNPIGSLALPRLSAGGTRKSLLKIFFISFAFTIPFTLVLVVSAPFVFQILFPKYISSVIYFQVLSISIVLIPTSLLYNALIAETQKKRLLIVNIARSSLKIILYLTLVPYLNIWGMVIGQVTGEIVWSIATLYFFIKMTSYQTIQAN